MITRKWIKIDANRLIDAARVDLIEIRVNNGSLHLWQGQDDFLVSESCRANALDTLNASGLLHEPNLTH